MLVYLVTNLGNGKQYVGMTKRDIQERWASHCSAARNGSPYRFHSAIRKYGEDGFKVEILHDDIDSDMECRTIEADSIIKLRTMELGYNATPGGTGGWVVPDEKYDEWLGKITLNATLDSNPRWSGYSDEFILKECKKIFDSYHDKREFSFTGILNDLREKFEGTPKSFSKNRFKEYNGFKAALSEELEIPIDQLKELSNKKTENHKKSLSDTNTGNFWYSNTELAISKQFKDNPGEDWVRGRKYGNKN